MLRPELIRETALPGSELVAELALLDRLLIGGGTLLRVELVAKLLLLDTLLIPTTGLLGRELVTRLLLSEVLTLTGKALSEVAPRLARVELIGGIDSG